MRGLEQHEMNKQRRLGAKLENKERGVGKNNKNFRQYINAARDYLRGKRSKR
jgi:hypothetical protein